MTEETCRWCYYQWGQRKKRVRDEAGELKDSKTYIITCLIDRTPHDFEYRCNYWEPNISVHENQKLADRGRDMIKECFVDVETTGTDPVRHGIIQIAGQIFVDGKFQEDFDFKVKPFERDEIDPEALTCSGNNLDQIMEFMKPVEVYFELIKVLDRYVDRYVKKDKFHFIGYNAKFDSDFMREWFMKNGDKYFGSWFWFPAIDVANLAGFMLMSRRHELDNFKLGTVAGFFGLEFSKEDLHNALEDIELTRKIFHILETGWDVPLSNGSGIPPKHVTKGLLL